MSALTGKSDGGCDDNCSEFIDWADINEKAFIEELVKWCLQTNLESLTQENYPINER